MFIQQRRSYLVLRAQAVVESYNESWLVVRPLVPFQQCPEVGTGRGYESPAQKPQLSVEFLGMPRRDIVIVDNSDAAPEKNGL
jgi:hypothetical protein